MYFHRTVPSVSCGSMPSGRQLYERVARVRGGPIIRTVFYGDFSRKIT